MSRSTDGISDNLEKTGFFVISFFGGIIFTVLVDFDRGLILKIASIALVLGVLMVIYNRFRMHQWRKQPL